MVVGQCMAILAGLDGTWSIYVGTARYKVVQGQHRAFMPVHNEKKVEIWSDDTDASHTDNRI